MVIFEAQDLLVVAIAPAVTVAVTHDQSWLCACDVLIRVLRIACC